MVDWTQTAVCEALIVFGCAMTPIAAAITPLAACSYDLFQLPGYLAPCTDAKGLFKELGVAYGVNDEVVSYLVARPVEIPPHQCEACRSYCCDECCIYQPLWRHPLYWVHNPTSRLCPVCSGAGTLPDTVGLRDPFDFVHPFADHKSIGDLVLRVGLSNSEVPLQTTRLRRAWQTVRDTADNAAKLKAKRDEDCATSHVHPERPKRVSRLGSYWLRHGLQELLQRSMKVSPQGEVRSCDLLELPQFRRLKVTVRDLQSLERFVFENKLLRCRQGSSDVLVTHSAYDEVGISDVSVHAIHIT